MKLGTIRKQPAETTRRVFNYTDALIDGDTVAAAALKAVTPSGLTIDNIVISSPQVFFWVSGGTDGERYTVELTTTTTAGEIFEDEVVVLVREVS